MNTLNSVLLEGNLNQAPVETRTDEDNIVCTFSIGTHRTYKKDDVRIKEESCFTVVVFSTIAESCMKHLHKGRGVRIVGRLKENRCDEDDQNNRSGVIIIAEHVEFKPVVKTVKQSITEKV